MSSSSKEDKEDNIVDDDVDTNTNTKKKIKHKKKRKPKSEDVAAPVPAVQAEEFLELSQSGIKLEEGELEAVRQLSGLVIEREVRFFRNRVCLIEV